MPKKHNNSGENNIINKILAFIFIAAVLLAIPYLALKAKAETADSCSCGQNVNIALLS